MKKNLIKYLRSDISSLIAIFCLSLLSVALSAAIPYFVGIATEDTISQMGSVDFVNLRKILLIVIILGVTAPLVSWIISFIASFTTYRLAVSFRQRVFGKIHSLPLRDIESQSQGTLQTLMTSDIEMVVDGFSHLFTMFFISLLTLLASLVMMFFLEYRVALFVVLISAVGLLVTQMISKKAFKASLAAQKVTSEYYSLTYEYITSASIVNAYDYFEKINERHRQVDTNLQKKRQIAMFYSSLINPVTRVFSNLIYVAVILIGGLAYIENKSISIGVITSLLLYATMFGKPLTELSNIATEIQNSLVAIKRIFGFLEKEDEEIKENEFAYSRGEVEFRDVGFRYRQDTPLIEHFNLKVHQGEVIAIVGPTGAGKSTLVNLLMGFYQLNYGEIYIDGYDINKYSKVSLRKKLGMVLQDTWLKQASIIDNLLYGHNSSKEEAIRICKLCHIDDLIQNLPQGYDTIIKEHSALLSSGEKQLITIARAMIANPPILLLDEATSNVDTRIELLIQNALEKMMVGKTTFIIAHRLKTIVNANKIIVLNKGRIEEIGTHSQLLANKGFYYRLFNAQFAGRND